MAADHYAEIGAHPTLSQNRLSIYTCSISFYFFTSVPGCVRDACGKSFYVNMIDIFRRNVASVYAKEKVQVTKRGISNHKPEAESQSCRQFTRNI